MYCSQKEREVPSGVLPVLQKIEIHSGISHRRVSYPPLFSILLSLISLSLYSNIGGHLSTRPLDGQMSVSRTGAGSGVSASCAPFFFRSLAGRLADQQLDVAHVVGSVCQYLHKAKLWNIFKARSTVPT